MKNKKNTPAGEEITDPREMYLTVELDEGGEATAFAFAGEGDLAGGGELAGAGIKSARASEGGLFTTAEIAGARHD